MSEQQAGARTGRRRGRPGTRRQILDAAQELFAERGFSGTSLRAIGAAAAVDPSLVHHYFGSKEGLFRAALEMPIDPAAVLAEIAGVGSEAVPQRLVTTFLRIWDAPDTGSAMVGFLRGAIADPRTTELLREYVGTSVLHTAASLLLPDVEPADAEPRVALVLSQLLGVVLLRKVLAVEPLAGTPVEVLVADLAPTVARYLAGGPSEPTLDRKDHP